MQEYRQEFRPAGELMSSGRMQRIRFRMRRENLRFNEELQLVPGWMWWLVGILYALALIAAIAANGMGLFENGDTWPPGHNGAQGALIVAGIVTAVALPVSAIILLIGYVHEDALRRGMNSTLWTLLMIMLLPAWLLTGFIIYFLVREPLPYHCTGCGAMVNARYNFCPKCKCNLRPACPQCRREVSDQDHFCPYCAYPVGQAPGLPNAT